MSTEAIATALERYEDLYGDHREEWVDAGYWPDTTFPERAFDTIEAYPDKRAIGPHRTETFADLGEEARRVAAGLQERGYGPGDVIAYSLPNWVTTNAVYLAITSIGAIAAPIVPIYRHREFEFILNDVEASAIFVPDEYDDFAYSEMIDDVAPDVPSFEETFVVGDAPDGCVSYDELAAHEPTSVDPDISPDDPYVIMYTSGTTGDPKGVVHTHNTLGADEILMVDRLGYTSETKPFHASPVTHNTGVVNALEMPFLVGMEFVLMDEWDPAEAIEIIREEECTRTAGATPFLRGLMKEAPANWESPLEVVACGGAYVSPELVREAREKLDCRVYRVYGLTEYPGMTKTPLGASQEKCAETDGKLQLGTTVKIADVHTGEERPVGEEGEILVSGPNLMVGYLDANHNDAAFEGKWFKTGDIGRLDEGEYLTITGRKKDVIVRGGENIPVKEVEDVLYEHPAVDEVAIVAMPDEEMQEKGCAYVRTHPGDSFSFDEMIAHLEEYEMAKQKYPERLELIEEFPRTGSGKIQKTDLRDRIADELGMDPVQR